MKAVGIGFILFSAYCAFRGAKTLRNPRSVFWLPKATSAERMLHEIKEDALGPEDPILMDEPTYQEYGFRRKR